MKKSIWFIVWVSLLTQSEANILDRLKDKTKNLGKQTPVDVAIYAKNPSHVCTLSITNMSNPYHQDLTQSKLMPINIKEGKYYREDVHHLLKGAYEFEYKWMKGDTFIDSRLKTIHIFAYHDTRNKIHKKVNLTFLLRVPRICK